MTDAAFDIADLVEKTIETHKGSYARLDGESWLDGRIIKDVLDIFCDRDLFPANLAKIHGCRVLTDELSNINYCF
jgi:hypothetical protein